MKKNLKSHDVGAKAQPDSVRTAGLNDDIGGVLEFEETLEIGDQAMPVRSNVDDLESVPDSVSEDSSRNVPDQTAKQMTFDHVEECVAAKSVDDISVREEEDDTSSDEAEAALSDDEFAEDEGFGDPANDQPVIDDQIMPN